MPAHDVGGARPAHHARRAVIVAGDGEIRWLDRARRGLARKELDAGFLGGEARGETRGTAGSFAAVLDLFGGEDPAEVLRGCLREQTLDAGNLDGVDAAAAGRREGVRHRIRATGIR